MYLGLHCSVRAGPWRWASSAIGGLLTAWRLSQQGPFSAVHPPCVFPSVCVSCVPDCVYSTACVQSPVGKGQQGWAGLTCVLFPFFLALSLLVTHTCSLKYHSNLGSVSSLSVRECMFRIAITDKMCSDSISSRRISFKMMTRLRGGDKLSIRDEINTILGQVTKVQMRSQKYTTVYLFFEVFWSNMSASSQLNDSCYYKIILLCKTAFLKKTLFPLQHKIMG